MAQPFVGEIKMFAGNFAPVNYAFCNGKLLPISEYEALYALLGTTYGGDGVTTFGLPDLQGRVPVHQGTLSGGGLTYVMGQIAGVETVTVTSQTYPTHNHTVSVSTTAATLAGPGSNMPGAGATMAVYTNSPPNSALAAAAISPAPGSGTPHNNLQPYVCLSFIIALFGVFPSRN
ncbi:MAG: phage tail protein [Rudaea sp.]|uniref:phage tail protein n=1 Tax=unclassified Rudaea TaxID=2627037 RepID=UPI0010F5F0CE|nr:MULTISPECIES: tail fiber protein [unclassified Rudaea]MBN8887409.1 phage tail protein [Rudaea sp.]MBR0347550.1 phage tail protein [Rudaea sp.]